MMQQEIKEISIQKDTFLSLEHASFFTVYVNGETVLECVAYHELAEAVTHLLNHPEEFEIA